MQRIDSLALAKSASHFSLEHLFLPLPLRILARRVPELSPPSKPKLYTGLLSDKCVARRSSHARQLQAHKSPPPQKKKFAKTTKTNKPPLHSLSAAPERNAAAGRPSRGPESLLARTRAPTTMQVHAPHTHAFSTSSGPEPPPLYSQAPIGKGQLRQVQRNCGRGDQLLQLLTAPLSSLSLSLSLQLEGEEEEEEEEHLAASLRLRNNNARTTGTTTRPSHCHSAESRFPVRTPVPFALPLATQALPARYGMLLHGSNGLPLRRQASAVFHALGPARSRIQGWRAAAEHRPSKSACRKRLIDFAWPGEGRCVFWGWSCARIANEVIQGFVRRMTDLMIGLYSPRTPARPRALGKQLAKLGEERKPFAASGAPTLLYVFRPLAFRCVRNDLGAHNEMHSSRM